MPSPIASFSTRILNLSMIDDTDITRLREATHVHPLSALRPNEARVCLRTGTAT